MIINAARSYINAPFQTAGRSSRGIDCIGIPLCVARDLRVNRWRELWTDHDLQKYPSIREKGVMRRKLEQLTERGIIIRVELDLVQPGDMVLRLGGYGTIALDHHVSILSYDDRIIEARNKPEARYPSGRVVECSMTPTERRTLMGAYQFTGVS